jgi:hypothetical protein
MASLALPLLLFGYRTTLYSLTKGLAYFEGDDAMKALMTPKTLSVLVTLLALLLVYTTALKDNGDEDWLDALTNAVLIERRGGGGYPGVVWEPYLGQLQVVRTHFERGDVAATYRAMNRLMDMLEKRENGINAATADWLFDFCYIVTPAQYHDVSRHIEKFKGHQFEGPVG